MACESKAMSRNLLHGFILRGACSRVGRGGGRRHFPKCKGSLQAKTEYPVTKRLAETLAVSADLGIKEVG
jgi:hypothetical protein